MLADTAHNWPLTGREVELEAIEDAIGRGGGVLLDGDRGTGKSRLLAAALERAAAAGRTVISVGGTGRGREDSVEAFGSLTECLEWFTASRRREAVADPAVLGVDDAHLVDDTSAARLYQLVASGRLALATAVERGAPVPAGIDKLWVTRLVERIELGPFDRTAVAGALHGRLGGHVDTATLERLRAATGGNPLILGELVEGALADGSLRQVNGIWRWRGLAERPTERLAAVVHLGLRGLAPDEQELVNMLAVAQPLEAEITDHCGLTQAAESLNLRGVVAVEYGGHRVRLRLALPLSGFVVAARMSDLTARRLRRQVADWIEGTGARRADDELRVITLRLDAGLVPGRRQLLRLTRTAFRRQDLALAERLCRLALDGSPTDAGGRARDRCPRPGPAWEPALPIGSTAGSGTGSAVDSTTGSATGPGTGSAGFGAASRPLPTRVASAGDEPTAAPDDVPTALLLGRILAARGHHAEAETLFAAGLDTGARVPVADLLAAVHGRAANLAFGLRRLDDAAAVLDRAVATVGADRAPALQGSRAVIAVTADRLHDAVAIGDAALPDESADSPVTQVLLPAVAFARMQLGDPAGALELLSRCAAAVAGWDDDARLRHHVLLARCAFLMGDLHGCESALEAMSRHAAEEDHQRRLQIAVLRSRLCRAAGRPDEAVALLREASVLQGRDDWLTTQAWTLAQLAGALAESGRQSEALRTLVEARLVQSEAVAHPIAADDIALERALVLAHCGDRPGAAGQALEVARNSAAAHRTATAVAALHLAARVARAAPLTAQATRLAAHSSSELVRLQAEHIRALAESDGDALSAVMTRLRELGALPLAAEAAAQAGRAYRAAGQHHKSREVRSGCGEILADCGGTLPPWCAVEPRWEGATAQLTTREREIAALAAAGVSNRDIAGQLVLSVRTVENHLHRVYHKLAVTARAELARVLAQAEAAEPVLLSDVRAAPAAAPAAGATAERTRSRRRPPGATKGPGRRAAG
ncbi:LuxR C-terminal-related transcriptional regulator [Kitasatospora sp. NPDC048296]|uniref:helix-turn-helix transcriptional regulator n=1 Tax=Kitasatospora sp. NPDC048296 TaxID=3364048 RepID=UPI0037194B33